MIREEINKWTHGEDWRTWVAHGTLALFLSLALSPTIAVGFYFLRECDQVFYMAVNREKLHPFDHLMDVLIPAVVAAVVFLLIPSPGVWLWYF